MVSVMSVLLFATAIAAQNENWINVREALDRDALLGKTIVIVGDVNGEVFSYTKQNLADDYVSAKAC